MATLYFNAAVDGDWNELGNWWQDSGHTTPATSLPISTDDVVIDALILSNSGGGVLEVNNLTHNADGQFNFVIIINGVVTFNDGYNDTYIFNSAVGAIFNNSTFNNATIDVDTTFNGSSYNDTNGTINGNAIVVYPHVAPFINTGTITGSIYYSNYPTLYYNAANDNNWNNNLNWWIDSSYTQQSYNIPTAADTVYIKNGVYSDSSGSATANIAYVENSASIFINLTITYSIYFGDDSSTTTYGSPGVSVTLSVINSVYFVNGTATSDSTISFGNECRFSNSSTNGGSVSANGSGTGATYFDDSSSNTGTVGVGATPYTVDFSDNSTNSGTVNIDTNCNYPLNRNTFNTGTIISTITYVGYPTFYFYGSSYNWFTLGDWYTDIGSTTGAAYIPGSLDDVVIESDLSNTNGDMYAKNATIQAIISFSSTYTMYITENLMVGGGGGQIGTGFAPMYIEANRAEFTASSAIMGSAQLTTTADTAFKDSSSLNGGTVIAGAPGVEFYDTSTFTGGSITGNVTIFSPVPLPFTFGGSYSGSLSYSGYSPRTVYFYSAYFNTDWSDSNNWWNESGHTTQAYIPIPAVSIDDVIVESNLTQNTSSLDTTIGVLTVKNDADVAINITCLTATFEDTSSFGQNNTVAVLDQNSSSVSITFSEISTNHGYITVTDTGAGTPAVVFEDGSSNFGYIDGNVEVYYPVSIPIGNVGFITGTITYFNYSYYFNDSPSAGGGDWSDPDNWFLDSSMTVPANNPPSETMPGDNVILQSNVQISNAGTPTANNLLCSNLYINIGITVYGLATFDNSGYLESMGTITGDALFKDTSSNRGGSVTGTATFELTAAEQMIINGYDGTYGDVEFQYGKGVNGSSILGVV